MSNEEREKKKISDFLKGFLITYTVLIILSITSIIMRAFIISYKFWDTLTIVSFSSLLVIGIALSGIGIISQKKNQYISKGMIAAIFGLADG